MKINKYTVYTEHVISLIFVFLVNLIWCVCLKILHATRTEVPIERLTTLP